VPASDHVDTMVEWTKYWRDPALGGLDLLHARYITHAFGRHAHDTFAVEVLERGAHAFRYRGADHTPVAGDLVLLNPGGVHTGRPASPVGYGYRMLYPSVDLLRMVVEEVSGRARNAPYFPQPVVRDDPLAAAMRQLHLALAEPAPRLERESRLLTVLVAVVRRHAAERPPARATGAEPRAVTWAREFLEANADEDVSLAQLAAVAGLSPFHLARVFREAIGLPPHTYLDQVRVERAKGLLAAGLPIARAAADVGFADQSHLSRRFKRLVGVTPGQYRAGSKNVQDLV
jgi:AraC-like DNA-binding protein